MLVLLKKRSDFINKLQLPSVTPWRRVLMTVDGLIGNGEMLLHLVELN